MATLTAPTLTKLLTNVRNMLNQPNPANSFWTDPELTEYLNEGVRLYFAEVSLSQEGLFTTSTSLNIVSGTETVALPSDCFVVKAVWKVSGTERIILEYRNNILDSFSTQGGSSSTSYFPSYAFRGNSLVLYPTPQFSETSGLLVEYMQWPDQMTNASDTLSAQVNPIFKQLIEAYAVYLAKHKESLVNGVDLTPVAVARVTALSGSFTTAIQSRSKYPSHIRPFRP